LLNFSALITVLLSAFIFRAVTTFAIQFDHNLQ